MPDPTRELGHEYAAAVVDAIEAVVGRSRRSDFAYRGADLSRAISCGLFGSLVNDEALYDAFAAQRRGEEAATVRTGAVLGDRVARELLGGSPPAAQTLRSRALWLVQKLRYRLAALRRRPEREVDRSDGPAAAFLLDHSKFLRFIDPVVERLGRERVLVVPLVDEAREALPGQDLAYAQPRLDESPAGGAIGPALREYPTLLTLFDAVLEVLRSERPRCAVVVEGNSPLDEVASQASRVLGIPCLCLQQGWSPVVHNGFRGMNFTRMALWGEGFRGILAPYNPAQRFETLGNPSLAARSSEVGAGATETGGAVSFFLQPISPWIGEDHQRQMHELIRRTSERLPDTRILVREHPGWPLAGPVRDGLASAPNVELASASSQRLLEVLEATRVAVSIYSTTLLEAAALGIPPVVFNPTSMPRFSPDLELLGVGVETDRVEPALAAIERLVGDDDYRASFAPAMAEFRETFFRGADGAAPERIAGLIEDLGTTG